MAVKPNGGKEWTGNSNDMVIAEHAIHDHTAPHMQGGKKAVQVERKRYRWKESGAG